MRVSVPGGELFVRIDEGPTRDSPVLLLSNSLAADHTMWDPQIPLLTSRYKVVRYDTRGHGQSAAPAGDYDFAMLVDDARTVLDHVSTGRASFMGLSLGGMTGLGFALTHPERLDRLVVCDARADAPAPFVKSWDDRLAAIDSGGLAAILAGTLERWLVPAFRTARPDVVARVEAMILATSPVGYRGCAAALKRLDYAKDLGRIKTPTLYVVGAEDAGAPSAVMRAMADATPGATFALIDHAAHLPNLDNEAGFATAISSFLGLGR
jgi:3-oxoadipate enol-lactonase